MEKKLIYDGIIVSVSTQKYNYEQIQMALKNFRGYADCLTNLHKPVPGHIGIAIDILSLIEQDKRYRNYTRR